MLNVYVFITNLLAIGKYKAEKIVSMKYKFLQIFSYNGNRILQIFPSNHQNFYDVW